MIGDWKRILGDKNIQFFPHNLSAAKLENRRSGDTATLGVTVPLTLKRHNRFSIRRFNTYQTQDLYYASRLA